MWLRVDWSTWSSTEPASTTITTTLLVLFNSVAIFILILFILILFILILFIHNTNFSILLMHGCAVAAVPLVMRRSG